MYMGSGEIIVVRAMIFLLLIFILGADAYPENGYGVYTYPNGDRYEGNWINGVENGWGKWIWANGNKYEGYFKDGKENGHGKFWDTDGDTYEGSYVNGSENGLGKWSSAEGDIYEGNFENGTANGFGKWVSSSGSRYEGMFENDKFHGIGEYTESMGKYIGCTYVGEFQNDNIFKGTMDCPKGWRTKKSESYTGGFRDYSPHGYGILKFYDGDIYNGYFNNDVRDGFAIYTYGKTSLFKAFREGVYVGPYKNDVRNGIGILLMKSAASLYGPFHNGAPHGVSVISWPDGKRFKQKWGRIDRFKSRRIGTPVYIGYSSFSKFDIEKNIVSDGGSAKYQTGRGHLARAVRGNKGSIRAMGAQIDFTKLSVEGFKEMLDNFQYVIEGQATAQDIDGCCRREDKQCSDGFYYRASLAEAAATYVLNNSDGFANSHAAKIGLNAGFMTAYACAGAPKLINNEKIYPVQVDTGVDLSAGPVAVRIGTGVGFRIGLDDKYKKNVGLKAVTPVGSFAATYFVPATVSNGYSVELN